MKGLALEALDDSGSHVFKNEAEPALMKPTRAQRRNGDAFVTRLWHDEAVYQVSVEAAQKTLDGVRQRAEGWRNGASASLALIVATMTVKGAEDGIGLFRGGEQALLIIVLAAAISLALASLYRFLRAAHGPSWLDARVRTLSAPLDAGDYLRRAGGAAYDLRLGQLWWLASIAVYFLTVVLVWTL